MRSPVLAFALAAGLLCSSVAPTGRAQDASQKAMAEALFQQAHALMAKGEFPDACSKFAQSQKLDPTLATLLNLAICDEKLGKTASAWAEFTEAANQAHASGETKREQFARERATALQATLSMLTLRAPQATGLQLSLDGKPFDGSMLGTPLPVDPGDHHLSASATAKKPWSKTVRIPAGPSETPVEIPALEDAPASAPAVPAAATPAAQAPAAPAPGAAPLAPRAADTDDESGVPSWAWIGLGVGGVGLLAGTVTGSISLAMGGELTESCPNDRCSTADASKLDTATALANVSNVTFVIGALGTAIGVVGLFTAGGDDETSAGLTPLIGPGYLGLRARAW